ncbi:alpha/beta-hydrolase [Choiromyces venosus 120613-1]|uniref:Carboxylic ester hydrolase n=1 Tax=Choiromyces venosus 120613-1 TaxID=1336337 RepID=A0A3N4K180_9PEZI|nr:alpha/beta-hydrolase [Choiromyces venosus 120613-1]
MVKFRTVNVSEDCLYLELYGCGTFKPNAKKPVVVWLYGGGYIQGGGATSPPPFVYPTLNVSARDDFIVVLPNYRVDLLRFLAGRAIEDNHMTDLNVGLLDQQAALKWARKCIHVFGGDPNQVTLWGQSAGAGSVLAQVIANGGNTSPPLSQKSVVSSPFMQKRYSSDSQETEAVYSAFVNKTGCAEVPKSQTISCLRTVDVQTIREVSLAIYALNGINPEYALAAYYTHEGENFVPSALQNPMSGDCGFNATEEGFDLWMRGYLQSFSASQIAKTKGLYSGYGDLGAYKRAADVYRDSWNTIQPAQTLCSFLYRAYAGGYASFVQTGDPNTNKITDKNIDGFPEVGTGKLFLIGDGGVANSTTPVGNAGFAGWQRKCNFGGPMPWMPPCNGDSFLLYKYINCHVCSRALMVLVKNANSNLVRCSSNG